MIKSIQYTNIKGHLNTLLELSEGVNIIKGTSHKGKSVLIHGVVWALKNTGKIPRPYPHLVKRNEEIGVKITFTEGSVVERRQGKDLEDGKVKNRYIVNGNKLDVVQKDVPDEVLEVTRMGDINLQRQGDSYFLIGDSSGAVGRKLNEFIGLQIIDQSKSKINQIVKKVKTRLEITSEQIKEKEEALLKYENLDKIGSLINRTKSLEEKFEELTTRRQKISSILNQYNELDKEIKKQVEWLTIETQYKALLELVKQKKELSLKRDRLTQIIENIKGCDVKELTEWLEVEKEYKKLNIERKRLAEMRFKHDKIVKLYTDIRHIEKVNEKLLRELDIDEKRQSELQKSLDYCQKCGAHKKYWKKR